MNQGAERKSKSKNLVAHSTAIIAHFVIQDCTAYHESVLSLHQLVGEVNPLWLESANGIWAGA